MQGLAYFYTLADDADEVLAEVGELLGCQIADFLVYELCYGKGTEK